MTYIPQLPTSTGVGTPRMIRETAIVFTSNAATTTYTSTSATDSNGITAGLVLSKMRIRSHQTVTLGDKRVYGKVLGVSGNVVSVDSWVGGTPTDGKAFTIDGWIADLPRTQQMVETFTPEGVNHELWNYQTKSILKGYRYEVSLNYEQFISPDALLEARNVFYVPPGAEADNIILIPRKDKPGFNFNVYLDGPLPFTLHPSRIGHSGLSVLMKGKQLEAMPSPFNFGGFGFGFGQNYGIQL